MGWQNIHLFMSLLQDFSNADISSLLLTGTIRKCPTYSQDTPESWVPLHVPSLQETSTPKSVCLPCLSDFGCCRSFTTAKLFSPKHRLLLLLINCQQQSLEATASSSSCCLQTKCRYFLAGSIGRSHKSFLYFQIYCYGCVWPFQDKSIKCAT